MPSVIVVGGGVIGCATAYYLARDGADVTIMERGDVSGEASGAAAGVLATLSDHGAHPPFFNRLCEDSLRLFDELLPVLAETGVDVRHRSVGLLEPAVAESEIADLEAQFERHKAHAGVRWLDGAEARSLEPGLSSRTRAAILTPATRYLDPQRLTQAFAAAARREGVTIREHEAVTRFMRRGDRLRGVLTANGTYEADEIIIAGGPWTTALANRLGANIPVRPVRGQMMSLESPETGLRHIISGARALLVPREDGQTYVGATVEEAGYRKHTTAAGLRGLRAGGAAIVPALENAKLRRAWAGLRPATPDGLPVMGRLPGWRNAWVSSGHFRTGILLSPVSGRLLAQAIAAGREDALPRELAPARFSQTA
ncbi:MAG TPA: glycine oxidase ThiO [Dehalococcoidia bacterium]|nr:glycine oxidase ThiO [Dehalococcoidia bacterium]